MFTLGRKSVLTLLVCVAVTACVIVPLGQVMLPADMIGTFIVNAAEAVITTTLGFALYGVLSG